MSEGHGHSHDGPDPGLLRSRDAMRALLVSLLVLLATAAIQIAVVVLSGSVALLADTVHNVGDALTAVPLGVAFLLLRRGRSPRLTYGWGRAEDFAGLAVVAVILFSAAYAAWEAVDRLVHPSAPDHLLAAALAGVVGFAGNEWVAILRLRAGRRIGSAALVADGHHARVDGVTSLGVVAGVVGVALGVPAADPIVGLLISAAILRIVWASLKAIGLRAMDGVEDGVVDDIRAEAAKVPEVRAIDDVRARWIGHVIRTELRVALEPDTTVEQADAIAGRIRGAVIAGVEHVVEVVVEPRSAGAQR
jgi:cation diffusion facilitator family transporter